MNAVCRIFAFIYYFRALRSNGSGVDGCLSPRCKFFKKGAMPAAWLWFHPCQIVILESKIEFLWDLFGGLGRSKFRRYLGWELRKRKSRMSRDKFNVLTFLLVVIMYLNLHYLLLWFSCKLSFWKQTCFIAIIVTPRKSSGPFINVNTGPISST